MKTKKKKYLIEWRRRQVIELISKGHNQTEVSDILKKKYIGDHMPKNKEKGNSYGNDNHIL